MRDTLTNVSAGKVAMTLPADQPLPLLDKAGAAAYLRVSKRTIERLVRDKELSPIYVGRLPRFDYADLRAFTERNRIGGCDATT